MLCTLIWLCLSFILSLDRKPVIVLVNGFEMLRPEKSFELLLVSHLLQKMFSFLSWRHVLFIRFCLTGSQLIYPFTRVTSTCSADTRMVLVLPPTQEFYSSALPTSRHVLSKSTDSTSARPEVSLEPTTMSPTMILLCQVEKWVVLSFTFLYEMFPFFWKLFINRK